MIKSMVSGPSWKQILIFSLPVLAGSLLQQLYNTVDTIIVGKFSGETSLSAVGTTASLTFLFLAIAMGFSAGNGVVIAQHHGANNHEQVRKNASTGIIFLLSLGLISTVAGILIARPALIYFVKVPQEILEETLQYFIIYCLGLVFQYGYNIFSSILRAVGDSAATLYFLLLASVLNIILDLLFVAVFNWGVIGAAVATDIAQAVSFVAAYIYMKKRYAVFNFKLKEFTFDFKLAKDTVKIGFPIALQLVLVSFGLTFIQRAVNEFGQTMTASATVGQRIEMYMNLPASAFQTTMATFAGQNIGAGKMNRVKKGAFETIGMSLGFTIIVTVLVWAFTKQIIGVFGLSDAAAVYCTKHLRAIALVNIMFSFYIPLFGLFQGANHSQVPTVVATIALGIRVVVTYLFRYTSFFGTSIIWWNGLFGFGFAMIVTWIYFLSNRWQKNSVIDISKK